MYKIYYKYGTKIHVFEFDPELYTWTYEFGKNQVLETLSQIAPGADYSINWSVFDWCGGRNGYGRIQNGSIIQQESGISFPTVSFADGKLQEGEFPEASPGFARWRVIVRNRQAVTDFVVPGNYAIKDARTAIGQLENGNIVFMSVEGDDTQRRGMTCKELGIFAKSLGCVFACDCDGGGSVAAYTKDGYKYNQGRAIAGAMVVRKKTMLELCESKIGYGYAWGTQGEILTPTLLGKLKKLHGAGKYDFDMDGLRVSASKWLGEQCFDCSGLIVWTGRKLGVLEGDHTAAMLYGMCDKTQNPKPGDLCFNENLTHVGIYAGNGSVIHARGTYWGVVATSMAEFAGNIKFGRLKGEETEMNWDKKAVEFVKKFQAATGLVVDGMAGNDTDAMLDTVLKVKQDESQAVKEAWRKFKEVIER